MVRIDRRIDSAGHLGRIRIDRRIDSAGHLGRKGSKGTEKPREEKERRGGAKASDDGSGERGMNSGLTGSGGESSKLARGRRAAEARSVRRWTRVGGTARGPVNSGAAMSAEPNGIGADLVKWTVDVSEPVGEDGVRVAEDMTPKVERE